MRRSNFSYALKGSVLQMSGRRAFQGEVTAKENFFFGEETSTGYRKRPRWLS